MKYSIEKGRKTDADEIGRLYDLLNDYLASHINYPGWIKGTYPIMEDAVVGIEEDNLYVLRHRNQIIGSVILSHKPESAYSQVNWHNNFDYDDIFVVHTLVVHPLYLKKGIGKQIMEFIIEYSQKQGMRAIRLDVFKENIPAINLYKQYGFEYIDTIDLGYGQYGLDYFELYQKIL